MIIMKNYPTPHIDAVPEDFAKTVIMPGDPKRSRYIAENFLQNARLINDVRGVQGYTGEYNGKPVTVMASGMGIPSMSIYAHELFTIFGVENIIRIGTMGGYVDDVRVNDVVLALAASTDSNKQNIYGINGHIAPCADYTLLKAADETANEMNIDHRVGAILTSDSFYKPNLDDAKKWRNLGIIGTEMETAGLYLIAAQCPKKALSILTVSDHVINGGEQLTSQERERSTNTMITLALNTAYKL